MILLSLLACGEDEETLARLDALESELATLQADNASMSERIAVLEADLIASDGEILALQEELAAWTGAVDLSDLQALAEGNREAIAALDARLGAVEADYLVAASLEGYATQAWVAEQSYATEEALDSLSTSVSDNSSAIADNSSAIADNSSGVSDNAADIADLGADLQGVLDDYITGEDLDPDLVDLLDYLEVDTGDHSVAFSGANVYVQSGSGSTDGTVNGLGNLVLGYDEDDGGDDKSGSHNLVVGIQHSYSGFAGIVAGENNEIAADYASVLGGEENLVGSEHGVVVGGNTNEVQGGLWNVLVGGISNYHDGYYSVLVGGQHNDITGGGGSTLLGGFGNEIYGGNEVALVGGQSNTTDNVDRVVVVGGRENEVTEDRAVAVGGYNNSADHAYSVMLGGSGNATSSDYEVTP